MLNEIPALRMMSLGFSYSFRIQHNCCSIVAYTCIIMSYYYYCMIDRLNPFWSSLGELRRLRKTKHNSIL